MKREWKPGDVAQYGGDRVFRATDESDNEVCWITDSGGWMVPDLPNARPLAVIDPEAEIPDEWATVFWAAYDEHPSGDVDECSKAALAALFAHIAAPPEPKPEEPTGDRATVRDRDGVLWTRDNNDLEKPWRNFCSAWRTWPERTWSDLDVPADGVLWGGVES